MPRNPEEAGRYNRAKVRLTLSGIIYTLLYLVFFQIFLAHHLKTLAFALNANFYCALAVFLAVFGILYYVFELPLRFYSGFILEHKFRLSNMRILAWFSDDIKKGVLSLAMFVVFMQALYFFLRNFAASWWVWIAAFYLLATVVLARITPLVVIPLFFKYHPVGDDLKNNIIKLSEKCGIKVLDVYKIDFSRKTSKLNAAVVGMGRTRRVLLADNLVESFTYDEIAGVLAHEFGHHKMFHIWKLLAFGTLSTFFSFFVLYLVSAPVAASLGAERVYDISIFPAFMLILFLATFALGPLQNAFSRRLERNADLFALKAIKNRDIFISLMRKLAERNLSDPNPPAFVKFLFYDHPPISERIKMAEKFGRNF